MPSDMLALLVRHHFSFSGKLDLSKQLTRCSWAQSSAQSSAPPSATLKSPLSSLGGHVACLHNLRDLLLDGNGFTSADAPILASVLTAHASSLRTLSLKGGPPHHQTLFSQPDDVSLWPQLRKCSLLTRLDLSHNNLAASALDSLFPAVGNLCLLQELYLRACSLRDEQAEVLCYAVRNLEALRKLDIGYNALGHPSFMQLALSVRKMTALEELDVSQTNPDLSGLACLLAAACCAPIMHSFVAEDCKVYSWVPQPPWPSPRVTRCSAEQLLNDCQSAVNASEERGDSLGGGLRNLLNMTHGKRLGRRDADLPPEEQSIPGSVNQDVGAGNTTGFKTGRQGDSCQKRVCSKACAKTIVPQPKSSIKHLKLRSALGSYLGPLSELITLSLMNLVSVAEGDRTTIEAADAVPQARSSTTARSCWWKPVDMLGSVETLDMGATSFLQVPSFLLSTFFGSLRSLQDLNLQDASFDQGVLWDVFHTLGQKYSFSAVAGLTSLYLSSHPTTAGELVAVCRICTLRKLTLKQCSIGSRKVGPVSASRNGLCPTAVLRTVVAGTPNSAPGGAGCMCAPQVNFPLHLLHQAHTGCISHLLLFGNIFPATKYMHDHHTHAMYLGCVIRTHTRRHAEGDGCSCM